MNPSNDQESEVSRLIIGADGEVISGALPVPDYVPPRKLPIRLSTIFILLITIIFVAGIVLTLLGVIRPSIIIRSVTRPACFARLGADRILFASQRDGDNGMFIMNADGTNICRLFDDDIGDSSFARASANGKMIYYMATTNGRSDLEVVDSDGSGSHQRTLYTVGDLLNRGFAVSPDGHSLAAVKISGSNSQVFLTDIDGSNPKQVSPRNADAYLPDWSPDGKQIVFVSMIEGTPHLFIVNADGTNLHRLPTTQLAETSPAWSSDSKQIIFSAGASDFSNAQIYLINADGSNFRMVTNQGTQNFFPHFSPDDRQIIFVSNRQDNSDDLYVMNLSDNTVHRLTHDGKYSYSLWLPH